MSRRRVLGGAVGLSSLLASHDALALTSDMPDPAALNDQALLDAYIRLRGSTVTETTYVQYDGDIIAVFPDRPSIVLMRFRGIAKSHWRPDGNGGYINKDYDVGVFVDHKTGKMLKTWRNPVTDTVVDVIPYTSGPSGGHFKAGIKATDPYGSGRGRWGRVGDTIWQTDATVLSWPNVLSPTLHPLAWTGATIFSSMSTTYSARTRDVLDPRVTKAHSTLIWNDILSPHPWMRIGTRKVMCDWRMIGAKAMQMSDLSPSVIAEVDAVFPGYIANDAVWTERSGGWVQYLKRFPGGEGQ